MEEITRVRLFEIAELITKGTTPTTLGYDFQEDGVNFLKIECFTENGDFLEEKAAHISDECHEKLKRSQLNEGDILFSIAGAIGRVAVITKEMLPANTNQALAIIRINRNDVYLPYIKLILTSPIVKTQFERKKQGVAQLNISLKDINELEIPLPEIEKQKEYAMFFGKVMSVISACQQEIQKLDDLIKARFVELFDNAEYGVKSISELSDLITKGTTPTTAGYSFLDEGINFFKIESIKDDHSINLEKVAHVGEDCHKAFKRSQLKAGDILFSIAGAIGRTAIIEERDLPGNTNQALAIIRLKNRCEMSQRFLISALESPMVVEQYNKKKRGIAQINLSLQDIGNLRVIVPPLEEQNQFTDFVKQVDKSKVVVQEALDKAQLLFDSLMQQYFG